VGRLRPSCSSEEYSLKAYVYIYRIDDDAETNNVSAENLNYLYEKQALVTS
jgi:hypothetical protein